MRFATSSRKRRRWKRRARAVKYLNIGDPIPFGWHTPPHLVEAVARAVRDGHNGYTPSPGILPAREAVAHDFTSRGFPATPDRVLITSGTSEGIELALNALVDVDDEVLVPVPTYPLYTAVLAKSSAKTVYYRTDPAKDWQPDLDHIRSLITPRTRALVVIDPNNPTGAVYPRATKLALLEIAEQHNLVILSDEVYGDLAYTGPVEPLGSLNPDAPVIAFSSLSKAYLAPGWRAGWMVVGRTPRLDDALAGIKKLADGRLVQSGADAVRGDGGVDGRPLASGRVQQGARRAREADGRPDERDPGHVLRHAARRVLRDALGDAAAGTHRRGLHPRPAAREGRALRLRLGLRHESRRRVLPYRVPGAARRTRGHLRRHRRRSPRTTIAPRGSRPAPPKA